MYEFLPGLYLNGKCRRPAILKARRGRHQRHDRVTANIVSNLRMVGSHNGAALPDDTNKGLRYFEYLH